MDYQLLRKQIQNGFPANKKDLQDCLKPFWNIRNELSIEDDLVLKGYQLLIPKEARKIVMERLHDAHQGIVRTLRRARNTVYWPAMSSDIKNIIYSCEACQTVRPSQQKETMRFDPPPTRPFVDVSSDLFACSGKHYMVYVDRFSGWPIICHYGNQDPTSNRIIQDLKKIFADTGVPIRFRSDNGPQYHAYEFKSFCKDWNIEHSPSTPYYPLSNVHAEAAVGAMKDLLFKCTENGKLNETKFLSGLLEWRNTPSDDGFSPAQKLYGRDMRSLLPTHHNAFDLKWKKMSNLKDVKTALKHKQADIYNKNAKDIVEIKNGEKVRIQNPISKLWDKVGVVVEVAKHRQYTVKLPSGKLFKRNRRYLRPCPQTQGERDI